MEFFLDTEFVDLGDQLELISVGVVSRSGEELYLVNGEMDRSVVEAAPWVVENVLPLLPPESDPAWCTRSQMRSHLEALLADFDGPHSFWAWNGAHDKVVTSSLWGPLVSAPKPLRFFFELKQLWIHLGRPLLPEQVGSSHDALEDALHNLVVFEVLAPEAARRGLSLS